MPAVVDREKCDGCKTCIESCPNQAIELVDGKAQVKAEDCIECEACVNSCPNNAISMG